MKTNIRVLGIALVALCLTSCSSSVEKVVETAPAKSDLLACQNMNMDYFIEELGASNLGLPSERLDWIAQELRGASVKAESQLLKNIIEDNAQSIENMKVVVDGESNGFFLQIAGTSLQEVVDACSSVR